MGEVTQDRLQAGEFVYDVRCAGPADGSLVLLLHGFPQTSYTWRAQLPVLGDAGYRAVAPDQRGYSPGARPDGLEPYRTGLLVADVIAFADALGAERFHLVGHDWGGALSWLTAAWHPERLKSLTILSRPHPDAFARAMKDDPEQPHRSRHHKAFQNPDTERLLLEDGARRLRRNLAGQGVPPEAVEAYSSVLTQPGALAGAINWYRATGGDLSRVKEQGPKGLGPISVPTLYFWGDRDSSVGPAAADWTADHVTARYRREVMPGLGHFLTDEGDEANELINQLLLEHLAEND